jgi:hypothetical protein
VIRNEKALEAFRSLTTPGEFIWAVDVDYSAFLFDHTAVTQLIGERITLSGQALLDAFERHKPRLLATVIAIDGADVSSGQSSSR